jgi:RNA polymerase-binding transcription factor DksA
MAKKTTLKKVNKKKPARAKSKPKAKPSSKKTIAKAKPKVKAKVKTIAKKVSVKAKVKAKPSKKSAESQKKKIKLVKQPSKSPAKVNNHKPVKAQRNSLPMKKDLRKSFAEQVLPEEANRARYSDSELEEFRVIINKKLDEARRELDNLTHQITTANEHGTDDTSGTFKILEDGSESLLKEEAGQLAARQKKFIEQLENALVRIENKTYGICRVTGKLIPKERLRAVPHTTQSIEAKLNQYRD